MQRYEGNFGEAVEQEDFIQIDEKKYVSYSNMFNFIRKFTYLGDRVRSGRGCVAAVTDRTIFGWVKSMECGELLYGR